MRLTEFSVSNFRSINDSGKIDVAKLTALLGRNESGKSNLLRALASLNPIDGIKKLDPIKNFPRHRRLEECNDRTPVVSSRWQLDDAERQELGKILPRAAAVTHVTVQRQYDALRLVGFVSMTALTFDPADTKNKAVKTAAAVRAVAGDVKEEKRPALLTAADTFEAAMAVGTDHNKWAATAVAALKALRTALAAGDTELSNKQERVVVELEELADSLAHDETRQQQAKTWVLEHLPKFIFLEEYPELPGHQNIAEYLARKSQPNQSTESDKNFGKLCKVAGLEPQNLQELLAQEKQEARNQLANRAGAVVTSEIRRLWKDRALKVRFNLDANHLDTLVSDPNATYDVEVNLGERSRGFQWFFSFYITFAADTKGGNAENAILLLDEPGLYLHARSQTDLLRHLENDFKNQILYTTHSPFMVPTHALDSVRTVNIDEDKGTTVSNDPTGDARTLFPLQAALGYNIAQSLFIGPNNLVVEGVTDFWILSSVSAYLAEKGGTTLHPELTITPAGGAQKVSYMVALLTSEELNVLVLLDEEKDAQNTKDGLVKSKLIAEQNVVFVSEAFAAPAPNEADIEDLLEPPVYEALVRESYAAELSGKTLTLNTNIPRIAKRYEAGLKALGIEFHKTRPTRLLLKKMSTDPGSVLTTDSTKRFEKLFNSVNVRLQKHIAKGIKAFP